MMRAALIKLFPVSAHNFYAWSLQVVNFMSTDTDRVVNFAPSFHQFWSLPFQIAVSLYLLHQQVNKIMLFDYKRTNYELLGGTFLTAWYN